MIKVHAKLTNFDIDSGQFTKALFDALETQVRQAAREFLRAIIISGKVPVYAGTARGSLVPLGQFLKVAVPISPTRNARKRKEFGVTIGKEIGAALGSFEFGRGTITDFIFRTNVRHYQTNEFAKTTPAGIHLIHSVPWESFPEGRKAFNRYLNANLYARVPRLSAYTKRTTITVQ